MTSKTKFLTRHSSLLLIQSRLHAPERLGGLGEVGRLLEGETVMTRGLDEPAALFIDAPQIEMREGVGFITRGRKRALKPTDAVVEIAFGDQITADVVVRIAECCVHLNRAQAFVNRLVVAALKTIDPTEKGVRFGGWIDFDGAAIEFDGRHIIACLMRFVSARE